MEAFCAQYVSHLNFKPQQVYSGKLLSEEKNKNKEGEKQESHNQHTLSQVS